MPKSRRTETTTSQSPSAPARPYSVETYLSGGNGTPVDESDKQRLARLETLVEQMRHEQDVQLRRIADLQAQLDRQTPPTHDR